MRESASRSICALIAVMLGLITLAVYWPARNHEFILFDDNVYLWENGMVTKGLTWANVWWTFTTFSYCNWHPLTWLSHMLDCQMFGIDKPGAHHMVNVAFHAANAVILFLVFNRMTNAAWRSAMVAALFALHPLHVESVAWVAERKDMLSTFFGFLSIWCYVEYVLGRKRKWYWLMLLGFVLSLLAKPMLVTLPFLLVLLDVWPLKRFWILDFGLWSGRPGTAQATNPKSKIQNPRFSPLILEKLPLLALSIASGLVTVYAQKTGGAVYPFELLTIPQRIANAVTAYAAYVGKMFWPVDLAILYPLVKDISEDRIMIAAAVLFLITTIVIVFCRTRPYLLVGWLWYLGSLVPVIGLLQVGLQSMADRYTYVPLIGIFIMIVWSVPDLSRLKSWQLAGIATACAVVLAALAWVTRVQLEYWRESLTLFTRALAVTKENYFVHNLRGFALSYQKRYDEAIPEYAECLRIHKKFPTAHANWGSALLDKRDYAGAAEHFRIALNMLSNNSWLAQQDLGAALLEMGQIDEAMVHFREALRIRPQFFEAHVGLARALSMQRRMAEAIPEYEAALKMNAQSVECQTGLGVALAHEERQDEALVHFREALRLQPNHPTAQAMIDLAETQIREKKSP